MESLKEASVSCGTNDQDISVLVECETNIEVERFSKIEIVESRFRG
jgi:hypothetical protein